MDQHPSALDEALRPGAIRSVYQPIVEFDSGRVMAYEALARGPVGPLEHPNLLFAAASTSGLVSITSVLASLYPIVTVMLARLVLKERVARSQEAGIALTLAGVALISAG